MRRKIRFLEMLQTASLSALLLTLVAEVVAQQQAPTVTHPSASSVQVTPRTTTPSRGGAVGTQTNLKIPAGTITGYVYWDMDGFQPSSSCRGLTVQVGTLSKVSPQVLATANNLTPMGPLTDMSSPGMPKYMLCSYSFNKLPEQMYLRVSVSAPTAKFSPLAASASPFQISGGNCTNTPSGSLSFILTGGEMLCGDNAFNINVKLSPANLAARPAGTTAPLLNATSKPTGLLANGGAAPNLDTNGVKPNTTGGTLLIARTNPGSGMTPATPPGLLTAKPAADGNPIRNIGGAGGYTGPTRPGEKDGPNGLNGGTKTNGSAASIFSDATWPVESSTISGGFVPKMPPMSSNARRDASPPADAAAKAQIRSKVQAQVLAANHATSAGSSLNTAQGITPEIQTLQRQMTFVSSLRTQGALTNTALLTSQSPNQVRIKPPSSSNPMLHAPQPPKFCPAPQIHSVNGAKTGVIFTQDPAYNDYVIAGCGFGIQPGQAYLSGAITGGRINLVIKQWSDTQIEAVVQPGLTGVLDGWPDLIVVPSTQSRIKFPNCRFYAQRQSVLLQGIPRQYVTLANVVVGDATHGFGTKYCSGPDLGHLFPCIAYNAWSPLGGITNGHDHRNDPSQLVSNAVDRDGGQLQFNSGEDIYDISGMTPGFEVDYASVFWYAWTSEVCEGWSSDAFPKKPGDSIAYDTEGYYHFPKKTKNKVVVGWGVDHCAWRWLGIFKVDDWYNSGYSLQLYVVGPIGVDPWTGHPVTTAHNFGQATPNRVARLP
jgi:hypothetical protein